MEHDADRQAMRARTHPPKHFSMLRTFHLADFVTLANAACGMLSVFYSMLYIDSRAVGDFFIAAGLMPAAFVFDVLDGRIARWRHQHSALGRELDSLADIVSFGVAPAALGFAAGLRGGWDVTALVYFVCCGVSRLARFNVTAETLSGSEGKVKYFEGTPIPTSVVLVAVLAWAAWKDLLVENLIWGMWTFGWSLHPLALLFVLSGTLMISKTLQIPKF
jgi:CDP-diacylglycerol--serine O-phosphatidyltransferase